MALSLDTPDASCIRISVVAAVISSIRLIRIFPFSTAFRIFSIRLVVVRPAGNSVMLKVLLSIFSILARLLSTPPRSPSLYLETSIRPPVGKSG